MNINLCRNAAIRGNIATVQAQIKTWEVYQERTDVDVSEIIARLKEHITALEALLR